MTDALHMALEYISGQIEQVGEGRGGAFQDLQGQSCDLGLVRTFVGPRVRVQMEATDHMSEY